MQNNSEAFQAACDQLNPAQRKAVETLYGPVLVVAGPGTGKTQVLALRIANILQKTDTKPQSILALTFTDSGAVAMRKRLLSFIGPTAHSVKIATFHSFCQDIISEFSDLFLFARKLEPIDDLTKIQALKGILETSDLQLLRPFKSPNFFLKEIQSIISSLKREGVSSEQFLEISQAEAAEFAAISEEEKINARTGKVKGKYVNQEKQTAKNTELHTVYAAYQSMMQERGYYDFDDMIRFVVEKMEEDENFRWSLRERYLFFLTDEVQDTNGLQMQLLELLAGEDEQPNIFAVGDDDQSIYRFQGASLENILYFQQRFPQSEIICLTENYRSTQQILDTAQSIIEHNQERLTEKISGLDKTLHSNLKNEEEIMPEIHIFPQQENEHFFLVETIRKLHEEQKTPYAEIAVLVRNNAEGFDLLEFFQQQNLPVEFSGRGNALKAHIVQQILNLLRLLEDVEDDALFFECLHYPFFQIPIQVIWELWEQIQKESGRKKGAFWKYWQAVASAKNDDEAPASFRIFCELLQRWHHDQYTLSLPELFQKIMTESGILESLSANGESENSNSRLPSVSNVEKLNHINTLFAEVKQFAKTHREATVSSFLETLAVREEFDLPLPERNIHTSSDTIQILTAHKAKGLEFEAVFITHAVSGRWGDKRNFSKITVPDGLLRFSNLEHDENEDERRLFFVACTRAKQYLFFTRSENDPQGRANTESRFLSEIAPHLAKVHQEEENAEKSAFEIVKSQMLWQQKNEQPFPEEFLRRAVAPENFSLSHSAFESYRENPQKFLWEYILRIPQVKHPSAVLGTALHRALEEFTLKLPEENIDVAKRAFHDSLQREILTEQEYADLEREGLEILENYIAEYAGKFAPAMMTELNFRSHSVMLDGVIPMTGKIDKVEWIDEGAKTVRIIDYKTTVPKSENEIRGLRDSDASNITAGRYFRQLVFYSLLCDLSSQFQHNADIFTLDFLIPTPAGNYQQMEFEISAEEKEALKAEIRIVWQKIQNLEFAAVNLWGDMVQQDIFGFLGERDEAVAAKQVQNVRGTLKGIDTTIVREPDREL